MRNNRSYIVDANMNPVPIGVPGELCMAGSQVARGYLNKPDKTAEKFLLDPFDPAKKRRMYRTGDVCKWRPDGNIEYVGRTDFQVKIRGYRIELGEIETTLKQDDRIQDCVVLALEHSGGKRLAAFVTLVPGRSVTGGEVLEFAKEHLAAYMVPQACVVLDRFPLTVNKKVDRRALPAPDWQAAEAKSQYVAPVSDVDLALVRVVCDVLDLQTECVSMSSDIYALGASSLTLLRIVNCLLAELPSCQLTVADVREHPTLSAIAEVLDASRPKLRPGAEGKLSSRNPNKRPVTLAQLPLVSTGRGQLKRGAAERV